MFMPNMAATREYTEIETVAELSKSSSCTIKYASIYMSTIKKNVPKTLHTFNYMLEAYMWNFSHPKHILNLTIRNEDLLKS